MKTMINKELTNQELMYRRLTSITKPKLIAVSQDTIIRK